VNFKYQQVLMTTTLLSYFMVVSAQADSLPFFPPGNILPPCDGKVVSDLKFFIQVDEEEVVFDKDILLVPSTVYVGQFLDVRLQESLDVCNRHKRVDLWVALEVPLKENGTITRSRLFMVKSPFPPFFTFSVNPTPLKSDLEGGYNKHPVLSFEITPGMGGNYEFYAAYSETGTDISDLLFTLRSNRAVARVVILE
jgi:hypothetical protein